MARELADAGYKCLVIDSRDHIAGNCHTSRIPYRSDDSPVWSAYIQHEQLRGLELRPKIRRFRAIH